MIENGKIKLSSSLVYTVADPLRIQQGPLERLCRKFIANRDSQKREPHDERLEMETKLAFDIILEVISSVYLLEPFKPSQVSFPIFVNAHIVHGLSRFAAPLKGKRFQGNPLKSDSSG